ncbi:MAG TPA: ElyC/SanA/YdcF family protein [Candidatus Bipolaricaulota bacterium]|nr:ElyC/SanA/YdcF family protein [Candidatus Bipolaricaulota bacterium]
MKSIAIVMGYGCHLSDDLKRYLDMVANFARYNSLAAIICSGGFTNKRSAPGKSEASVIAEYLRSQKVFQPIHLDESARTTAENLHGARKVMAEKRLRPDRIIIFCDAARAMKVRVLARLILGKWPLVITYDMSGKVIEWFKQTLLATPLDVIGLHVPAVREAMLARRRKIMEES